MESLPPCALSHLLSFLTTKEVFRGLLRCSHCTFDGTLQALTTFDCGATGKPAAVGVAMLSTFDRCVVGTHHRNARIRMLQARWWNAVKLFPPPAPSATAECSYFVFVKFGYSESSCGTPRHRDIVLCGTMGS